MTTLAVLKAQIATDLARSDLTSDIAAAITTAIKYFQSQRFYFNETRSATFATVAAQSLYSVADDADIPLFVALDGVFLTSSGQVFSLERYDPLDIERLLVTTASSGRPYAYGYYENSFRLYPIPDAAYTIRPVGVIKKAAPASDDEASNVWMLDGAFELIRCRAKFYLYAHTIRQTEKAQNMAEFERQALTALRSEGRKKTSLGRIVSTEF